MSCRYIIYTNNGDFEESHDLVTETLDEIATACQNGSVDQLETVINSLDSDQFSRYLNAIIYSYMDNYEQYLTPLMIASVHGQDSILMHKIILSYYDVDYDYYNEHFTKHTALWLAVQQEHLNVVRTLISLGKANVNHRADYSCHETNWTPLGLACANGQIEMVKYLRENGADLYNVDMNDSTSLMIASAFEHFDLVEYLLTLDYNLLNAINNKGWTALHEAVNGGHNSSPKSGLDRMSNAYNKADRIFDIIKLLFEQHQAKIVKDEDGYTPLTRAGRNKNEKLVKYFIENEKRSWYTVSQIIDELELIGSYHMMCQWHFETSENPYHYLRRAMELRYKDPKVPILKNNLLTPIEAYKYCTECQTIEQLELIKGDRNRLIMEGLMIQERLGVASSFLSALQHRAESYRDSGNYQRALQLYSHTYHLRVKTQIDLDKCISDLKSCANIMASMIKHNETKEIEFDLFLTLLKSIENEFLRNRNLALTSDVKPKNRKYIWSSNKTTRDIEEYDADNYLYIILNLLYIGIKILSCSDEKEQERRRILRRYIEQLIQLDYRTISDKKTLLHLSLMDRHKYTETEFVICFPSLLVVKFLLYCRAPINAIDIYYMTPLHELAANSYQYFAGYEYRDYTNEQMNDVEIIFKLLLDAGAHLDAVGQRGTPEDCARHEKIKNLFQKYPIELKLKCICARMIERSKLNYMNLIAKHLQSFVQLH